MMSKHLLLVRHAKADWGGFKLADFERPLTERGHRNAPEMAQRLLNKDMLPQLLVSSPALRAITTANYFAKTLGFSPSDILQEPDIYEAHTTTLLRIINHFDNRYDFIALFGHNPGLTELAIQLCHTDIAPIPTCGMVLIEFPFDNWQLLSGDTGEMRWFDYPL